MNFQKYNFQTKLLVVINLLLCLSTYINLPILALYLNLNQNMSLTQISVLITTPMLITIFFGFLSPYIIRYFKGSYSIIINVITRIIFYISLLYIENYYTLLVICILYGFAGVFYNPVVKYLFSYFGNKNVFRLRYFTICLGATIGPIITLFINKTTAFIFSIVLCCIVLIMLLIYRQKFNIIIETTNNVSQRVSIKNINKTIIMYILAGFLVFTFFSQFESVFSLTLKEFTVNADKIYSVLLTLNSLCGIVFQAIFIKFNKSISNIKCIVIGNFIFSISFMIFYMSNGYIISLILGVVVYSIGEMLVIPTMDILIDENSSSEQKALYFGLSEFTRFGFVIGPIFSAFLLEHFGYKIMFFVFVFIILISNIFYIIPQYLNKISRKDYNTDYSHL